MKVKLKSKFHDINGLQVSIDGAPIQSYMVETSRELLHKLIDQIECKHCLGRIMDTVLVAHPDSDIKEKNNGYKVTLKVNI